MENDYCFSCRNKNNESNKNSKNLNEFATENKIKTISIHFDHKNKHKVIWISPNEQIKYQIDHVLIEIIYFKAID